MDLNIYRIESTDKDGNTAWITNVSVEGYVSWSMVGNIWYTEKAVEKAIIKYNKRNPEFTYQIILGEIINK